MNKLLNKAVSFGILASLYYLPITADADWSLKTIDTLRNDNSLAYGHFLDRALAINDSGQVTGYFRTSEPGHYDSNTKAFITGSNATEMTALNLPGISQGLGINNVGQIVGTSSINIPFITGPNGTAPVKLSFSLGMLPMSINDSGQIAGTYNSEFGTEQAFFTGSNGIGLTGLITPSPMFTRSSASDINNSGQVIGVSEFQAFITGPNGIGMTKLGTLIKDDERDGITNPTSINNAGQVVGDGAATKYIYFNHQSHAFITEPNGRGMTDLGTLGGNNSYANSINDLGEVVGKAQIAGGEFHAFLFSHGGITDLSLLPIIKSAGYNQIEVTDINNNGQIIGNALTDDGHSEMFLLSYTPGTVFDPKPIYIPPVPEPQTFAMLLGGIGLIGFLLLYKRRYSIL